MRSRTTFALGLVLAGAAAAPAFLVAPSALAAPAAKPNTLTSAEKKTGFKLLFDGKTLAGFRGYKKDAAPGSWKVVDGAIVYDKTPGQGGDLMTIDQYDSFELQLDWKISDGGNSGVIYRVAETEDAPWKTGPEMQILDNTKHHDGKNPLTSASACYSLYPPTKDVTKPVGEWNTAKLVVDGNHVEHWLNGEKTVEYELGSQDFTTKVEASKFAKYTSFGKVAKGHLVLQDHGNRVEFRNLKLRTIKPTVAKAGKK